MRAWAFGRQSTRRTRSRTPTIVTIRAALGWFELWGVQTTARELGTTLDEEVPSLRPVGVLLHDLAQDVQCRLQAGSARRSRIDDVHGI
jgi:hypothetical protein